LATAKAFAAEGCRIMLSARWTEQLRERETALRARAPKLGSRCRSDAAGPDGAARLIEGTVAAYGGIDGPVAACPLIQRRAFPFTVSRAAG